MIDFDQHISSESARFIAAIRSGGDDVLDKVVPSCPDWRVADLVWHLTEVQDFWGHILGGHSDGPETYDRPPRPPDDALLDSLVQRTALLIDALRQPDENACWSWAATGGTVGWVRRRQAQEALIHRVDAELAAGDLTPIDEALAGDGVDEIIRVMLDVGELPPWASFVPRDVVVLDTGERWWSLRLGRFIGAPPDGERLDLPALSIEDAAIGPAPGANDVTRIVGSAANLNLWLWGRAGDHDLEVIGDAAVASQLRATAADATK